MTRHGRAVQYRRSGLPGALHPRLGAPDTHRAPSAARKRADTRLDTRNNNKTATRPHRSPSTATGCVYLIFLLRRHNVGVPDQYDAGERRE